jgi:hypothetical protein
MRINGGRRAGLALKEGAWHLGCSGADRKVAGLGLAARPEEDEGGRAQVVRERRGGAGLVGLQLGLVAGQGWVGGLWPGQLIWAERRWQIFCGVRICEVKAVLRKYAFIAGTHVPSGAWRTGLAKRNTSSKNKIPELRPE